MPDDDDAFQDVDALQQVIAVLKRLDQEGRTRLLQAVATFYGISLSGGPSASRSGRTSVRVVETEPIPGSFSEDRSASPKEFLFQKKPKTDVERVACLAYYLTHYRDTPHFKTFDISKLNTEAAQVKLSNAAYAVNNAVNTGYLAAATKGSKQISAAGELFVQALPDRDAAKAAIAQSRPRRKSRKQTVPRLGNA